jgi:hypothetical protein
MGRTTHYHQDGSLIAAASRCHLCSYRVCFTNHGSNHGNDFVSLCVGNVGHNDDDDDETEWQQSATRCLGSAQLVCQDQQS